MTTKKTKNVKISKAKGRPMLTWVGKRPLTTVKAYPAQHVESFSAAPVGFENCEAYLKDWPEKFDQGGDDPPILVLPQVKINPIPINPTFALL